MKDRDGHTNWEPGIDAPPAKKKAGLTLEQLKKDFPDVGEQLLADCLEYDDPAVRHDIMNEHTDLQRDLAALVGGAQLIE